MKYQVQHTFGSIVHEGTKHECDLILKAFISYGISEHKLEVVSLEDNKREGI